MNSEAELLQKLMISKQIMEKYNDIGRGNARSMSMGEDYSSPMVGGFNAPAAKYNIPQDLMEETRSYSQPKQPVLPTEDRIANSKLPDEIKKLMMEHPIQQPTMGMSSGTVLSDDLVEKASRLMNTKANGDLIKQNQPRQVVQEQTSKSTAGVSPKILKQIVKETVEDVLRDNGLLTESETKSNDVFKFRVGDHIFEGRVTKIKKIQK